MADNKPEFTLRDGALKATVWRNDGEKGPYFTTNLARTYKDDKGNYQDTQSFREQDLPRLTELSRRTYDQLWKRREKERAQNRDNAPQGATPDHNRDRGS